MYVVTVDAGTTYTRAKVWKNDEAVSEAGIEVGVRDTTITKSSRKLAEAVRSVIQSAMSIARLEKEKISAIIAAGMIFQTAVFSKFLVPQRRRWARTGLRVGFYKHAGN